MQSDVTCSVFEGQHDGWLAGEGASTTADHCFNMRALTSCSGAVLPNGAPGWGGLPHLHHGVLAAAALLLPTASPQAHLIIS